MPAHFDLTVVMGNEIPRGGTRRRDIRFSKERSPKEAGCKDASYDYRDGMLRAAGWPQSTNVSRSRVSASRNSHRPCYRNHVGHFTLTRLRWSKVARALLESSPPRSVWAAHSYARTPRDLRLGAQALLLCSDRYNAIAYRRPAECRQSKSRQASQSHQCVHMHYASARVT